MPELDAATMIVPVTRIRDGARLPVAPDEVVIEAPLEIRVRGTSLSVTMRTPGDDEELATGFLLAEGVIRDAGDIVRIEHCAKDPDDNVLNVTLAPEVTVDTSRLSRHVFASSSCGVCGRPTLDSLPMPATPVDPALLIDARSIARFARALDVAQPLFARTGGLHAAAVFGLDDETPLVVREDIGRHNAVDKVLGWAIRHGQLPLDEHVLLVSGRASFEIMQKALVAGFPVIASVSAPSSLAVELAERTGRVLIGFLRAGRMNVYSGGERVR